MPNQFTYGRTFRERLFSRLVIDPASGCLLWTGKRDRHGYGIVWANGRNRLIHRVMWEMWSGPIPARLTLDHVRERGCVHLTCANVAHLEPVTSRENILRGATIAAANAAKEECDKGHGFDAANTYIDPIGRRQCRTCRRAADRRHRARKRVTA